MPRGKFIVIDGMDGSGKGTQLALLRGRLSHLDIVYTREPGGNGVESAEFIRTLLLNPEKFNFTSNPLCDFFLFFASRALHIEQLVEPGRSHGKHVISDRYDSSTVAFQLYGEQKDFRNLFVQVRKSLPAYFLPDAYIILDLDPAVAFERRKKDMLQEKTRFDIKPLEYHERVRAGFRFMRQLVDDPETVHLLDADRPPETLHEELSSLVLKILTT